MTIALESMAVVMPEVEGHPNRTDFRGVLTVVDAPSQKAPSGAGGRRVVLSRKAAEAALPSLIGMALDFAPTFDRHDARRKVGVITSAELVGRNVEVGGYLYAKDFPDIVEEIAKSGRRATAMRRGALGVGRLASDSAGEASQRLKEGERLRTSLNAAVEGIRGVIRATRTGPPREETRTELRSEAAGGSELGMSFEVTNVKVLDKRARVWTLTNVLFTGAAILWRDKAAFRDTWIELVR